MLTLTETVLNLLAQGFTVLPTVIEAAQTEFQLWKSGTAPSEAQQEQIDAALDLAHSTLQGAQPGITPT